MNPEQRVAFEKYISGSNLFITGAGGVGKSFVLKKIINHARQRYDRLEADGGKKYVGVTALTGTAACLISGSTLHSWGGIGLAVKPVKEIINKIKVRAGFVERWSNCRLLIIDEISMMSIDLFEKIDQIARILRRSPDKFFGGLQVIFSGDFAQLPPVEKGKISFVFESKVWQQNIDPVTIYLTRLVRQSDPQFQAILTQARMGNLSETNKALLKRRVVAKDDLKKIMKPKDGIQPTVLFPYRMQVEQLNQNRLAKLLTKGASYHKYLPEYTYSVHSYLPPNQKRNTKNQMLKLFGQHKGPREDLLDYPPLSGNRGNQVVKLALGSQVLLTTNLSVETGLANGSRGVVVDFTTCAEHKPIVLFDNQIKMTMERSPSITEQLGFDIIVSQYPLELAWGLTVHKAIGATIPRVIADLSNCFTPGQAYVALSRCRSLDGLYLTAIDFNGVTCHSRVVEYYQKFSYKCQWQLSPICKNQSWCEYSLTGVLGTIKSCPDCLVHLLAPKLPKELVQKIIYFS